mmetsp:Transcript_41167/g.74380  ORF Transcript_41167/g.74380 Transcript_41167/m.74380 type:complete len:604 (+) Transcript_41167:87-1898(+)
MARAAHFDVAGLLKKHGYKEIKKVGEGSFGKALLVESTDGSKLISKMVDVSKASSKERQEAQKESVLLSTLKHPYIVRYRESFTDSGWLCILMDFCEGGDLTKQIEDHKRRRATIAEDQVLLWFTQAIMALKYIHDRHILHRDLKPSNFFLSKSGSLKMGDFGIAKEMSCTIAVARTQIGTPYYLSPELCLEKPYTWPSDVWAMGCILYEMCALKVPFDAVSMPKLIQEIIRGQVPKVPPKYSSALRDLCSQMLDRTPNKRPGAEEILRRPLVEAVVQKLRGEVMALQEGDQKAVEEPAARAPVEPPARPAVEPGAAAPYKEHAGRYRKNDTVEYYSSSHQDWLPAVVLKVDGDGGLVMDLKPNTWITKEQQATSIRPRRTGGGAPVPVSACASPMRHMSPMGRVPSVGSASPAMRAASPSRRPSLNGLAGVYRKGDLVDFYSNSHKEWLPATVINVGAEGMIIIDLKPNTWISKDEQAAKVRRRRTPPPAAERRPSGVGASYERPSSQGSELRRRSPSVDALAGVPGRTPWRSPSLGPSPNIPPRALTPSAASPRRPSSRGECHARAPSPGGGYGTPLSRPPGIPRVSDSPLRRGGVGIVGA